MTPATIIYDEQCRFCIRSLEWMRGRDRRKLLDAVGCRTPERATRFPSVAEEACLREMYLVDEEGRAFAGADAVAQVLRRLPAWRPIGWMLSAPGVKQAAALGYRLVARNRYRLGCASGHCER